MQLALLRVLPTPEFPQISRCHVKTSEEVTPAYQTVMVSVLTVHEPVTGNAWISERWRVLGVVAEGASGADVPRRQLVRSGPEGEQYLWNGFALDLRASDADSYYHNLIGGNPSIYVLAQEEPGGELIPQSVTIDYIEAMAYAEFGNEGLAVPMPPEIYRTVEQFVLDHYVPEEPRSKRKRDGESIPRGRYEAKR
jgi:hypothetical protein